MKHPTRLLAAAVCAYLACGAIPAGAQSHLKCYRVRDPLPKATYSANLTGFAPETCRILVPAVMVCVPSNKTSVSPPPPGGGATGVPNKFACYKIRCRRQDILNQQIHDQFGNRAITPRVGALLCAPSS